MNRRRWLKAGLFGAAGNLGLGSLALAQDNKWGAAQNFPAGREGGLASLPQYRVGNYSGGFETWLPFNRISPAATASKLELAQRDDFAYSWGFGKKSPKDYLAQWPVTGLLICRDNRILYEAQQFGRTPEMRMTSWSMAKSITSLLLGICLDRKLIASYDDPAEKYLPELKGTLHGGVSLRHLSNMASGADVTHNRDNPKIYPAAYLSAQANIARTVAGWNDRREEQGRTYNYNELCPLTIGMVLRQVTGQRLAEFAQTALWQPMGAEGEATWSTDSQKNEFNCIGFGARLRDWARLGMLVAARGAYNGAQIVSEAWISEITQWRDQEAYGKVGRPAPHFGYKAHMWHHKTDGSRLYFNGHHGQRVIIDMLTRAVVVQTAVDGEDPQKWHPELFAMLDAAGRG